MRRPTKHGLGGWYDAPQRAEQHDPGTLVAEPVVRMGCWACAQRGYFKGAPARARACSLRARAGRLTCHAHRRLERAARALHARLTAIVGAT